MLQAALKDAPRVHLIGLVSDGGVHSSIGHLEALVKIAGDAGVEDLVIHAFTDGRDTSPTSGAKCLAKVESWGIGRVGTVIGRYFAMDRDKRGSAPRRRSSCSSTARASIAPTRRGGRARGLRARRDRRVHHRDRRSATRTRRSGPGDSVIAFNFRPDRMRQITEKLSEVVDRYATMAEYDEHWDFPVLFPPARPKLTLAQVISERGEKQLHVAETEKYAHVTYFFNGGEEDAYEGEIRELVPSPRDVPTYDKKPEMSAREAADAFVRALERATSRRSRSSTSPTPTWSATPA